jgi:hypothetical protein
MTLEEEINHLTLKIAQVNRDIESFQQAGNADKKVEVLYDYLEYLQDEVKMLKGKV